MFDAKQVAENRMYNVMDGFACVQQLRDIKLSTLSLAPWALAGRNPVSGMP